jgi:hypothetical protein
LTNVGVLARRVLEFDHTNGNTVQEKNNVWASSARIRVRLDRELIDGQPVIVCFVLKIDQPKEFGVFLSSGVPDCDRKSFSQPAVNLLVGFQDVCLTWRLQGLSDPAN